MDEEEIADSVEPKQNVSPPRFELFLSIKVRVVTSWRAGASAVRPTTSPKGTGYPTQETCMFISVRSARLPILPLDEPRRVDVNQGKQDNCQVVLRVDP